MSGNDRWPFVWIVVVPSLILFVGIMLAAFL